MKTLTSEKNIFSNIQTKNLLFLYNHEISNKENDPILILELVNRYFKESRSFDLYKLLKNKPEILYVLIETELNIPNISIPDEHVVSFLERLLELVDLIKEKIKNNNIEIEWTFERLVGLEDLLEKFKTLKVKKPEFSRKINLLIAEINSVRLKIKTEIVKENKNVSLEKLNNELALRELDVLKIPVSQLKQKDWEDAIRNINKYNTAIQIKLLKRTKTVNDLRVLNSNPAHVLGIILNNLPSFLSDPKKSSLFITNNIDIISLFQRALRHHTDLENYLSIRDAYLKILDLASNSAVKAGVIFQNRDINSRNYFPSTTPSKTYIFQLKILLLEYILTHVPSNHPFNLLSKKEYYSLLLKKYQAFFNTVKDKKNVSLSSFTQKKKDDVFWSFYLSLSKLKVEKLIHRDDTNNVFTSSFYLFETMFIKEFTSIKDTNDLPKEYIKIYTGLLGILNNINVDKLFIDQLFPISNKYYLSLDKSYSQLLLYRLTNNFVSDNEFLLLTKNENGLKFLPCNSDSVFLKVFISRLLQTNFDIYDFTKKEDLKNFFDLPYKVFDNHEVIDLFMKKICLAYPDDFFVASNYFSGLNNTYARLSRVVEYFRSSLK